MENMDHGYDTGSRGFVMLVIHLRIHQFMPLRRSIIDLEFPTKCNRVKGLAVESVHGGYLKETVDIEGNTEFAVVEIERLK